jgi:hypothetical protein
VNGDHAGELLAREAAPAYDDEGPPALRHFSEDPSLGVFHPRGATAPLVRAVDTRHSPMFWFPRDCPRGCVWAGPGTSDEDVFVTRR